MVKHAKPEESLAVPADNLFERAQVIRRRGHFLVAVDPARGSQLVILPSRELDPERARTRLSRLVAAHGACGMTRVMPAARLLESQGYPYVELACSVATDFQGIMERVAVSDARCKYVEGLAWIEAWFQALRVAARAGLSFGALSASNMLVSPEGELYVIGLGDNVLAMADDGRPLRESHVFAAPEVASSGLASPAGDLYAFALIARSVMPFVSFPDRVLQVFRGVVSGDHRELLGLFRWMNSEILSRASSERASIEEAWLKEQRAWEILTVCPDRAGYRRFLLAHVDVPGRVLHVDNDLSYARVGSKHIALSSRRPLRRVLQALVTAKQERAGDALSTHELAELGWPDERPRPSAAQSRVYVALSSLRTLGLSEIIQRHDGGFRIHPDVRISVEAE